MADSGVKSLRTVQCGRRILRRFARRPYPASPAAREALLPPTASVLMRIPYPYGVRGSRLSRLGFVAALFAFLAAAPSLAQTATISGQVIGSDTGDPLIGATVTVPGTSRGAATDIDGNYSFVLPAGDYTLRASYIGYVTQDVVISAEAGEVLVQNFTLEADLTGLEEVVVTGALSSRSISRSEVSVARINAEELTDITPYQDIAQLLNGKVAGVNVQPATGNVGGGIRFNVRSGGGLNGSGQPLIFLDGVRVNNDVVAGLGTGGQGVGALSDLNPDDIANVEILKGPAASALYGTDASNGVVLITTKKGTIGSEQNGVQPLRIDYPGVSGRTVSSSSMTSSPAGATANDANAIFQDGEIQQHTIGLSVGRTRFATSRSSTPVRGRHRVRQLPGPPLDARQLRGVPRHEPPTRRQRELHRPTLWARRRTTTTSSATSGTPCSSRSHMPSRTRPPSVRSRPSTGSTGSSAR